MTDLSKLTPKMRYALDLMQHSPESNHCPTLTQPTRPIGKPLRYAFVNLATARALVARGLVEFTDNTDPLYGDVLLTEAGRAA